MLENLKVDSDGIYCSSFNNATQAAEIAHRRRVASRANINYLIEIAQHHSIPVMDREVRRVLSRLNPAGALILDVGGCWGWHWRNEDWIRDGHKVLIVDFVKENLIHAKHLLGKKIGTSVFLVHGDASNLPFSSNQFDLYWSVQTLQHIRRYKDAVAEGYRVLARKGYFIDYSLNRPLILRGMYWLLGVPYIDEGDFGKYFLRRGSLKSKEVIEKEFRATAHTRYSEIFIQPEFHFTAGSEKSILGALDARLSGSSKLIGAVARQISFEIQKCQN